MKFWRVVALGVAIAMAILAASILGWLLSTIVGCSARTVYAQSPVGCQPFGSTPGTATQRWDLAALPEGVTSGFYVVNLSDGEAEIAAIQPDGAGYDLIVPIPAISLPATGLGVNTINAANGIEQLGCPAITG